MGTKHHKFVQRFRFTTLYLGVVDLESLVRSLNCEVKMILFLFLLSPVLSDLVILSLPGGKQPGPEPCARTCSGFSRYDDTAYPWESYGNQARKRVDTTGCNFVSEPIITATVRGRYGHICPNVKVHTNTGIGSDYFYVMSTESNTPHIMRFRECSVYWTANGFIC